MNHLDFIIESNKIEGIHRDPTSAEIAEFKRFMALPRLTVSDLKQFVSVYQPDAQLRDQIGLDVRVGNHIPPAGSQYMGQALEQLLLPLIPNDPHTAHATHARYERLHPFTDCNGRSGRAIWAWQMQSAPLGFLHTFYYQTLAGIDR